MKALSHTQARLLIEQAADGLLSADQQRTLESHLQGCADCRAFAAEFAALEGALGNVLTERWGHPKLSKSDEAELVVELQRQFSPSKGGKPPAKPGGLPFSGWWIVLLLGVLGVTGGLATPGVINWLLASARDANLFASETPTPSSTPSATYTLIPSDTPTSSLTPTITPTSTSSVLILVAIPNKQVNCRYGAGSVFDIADTLYEGDEYSPIARGFDNLWVQFRGPVTNFKCWVFVENIDLLINGEITPIEQIPESLLPFITYPPTPTPTFTPRPERTRTPTSVLPQCSDRIDNDQDGAVDYPKDRECKSASDNDEFK